MEQVLALLPIILQQLPGAVTTGEQLYDIGLRFYKSLHDGNDPTPEEVAQLRAAIETDENEALTPLLPPQPGDPDYVKES